jgi:hypothetical protein
MVRRTIKWLSVGLLVMPGVAAHIPAQAARMCLPPVNSPGPAKSVPPPCPDGMQLPVKEIPCASVSAVIPEPGDLIRDVGLSIEVSAPGFGVAGLALEVRGYQELVVETDPGGNVTVTSCGSETPRNPDEGSPGSPPPPPGQPRDPVEDSNPTAIRACDDTASELANYKWTAKFHWRVNTGTIPADPGLTPDNVKDAFWQGTSSVTDGLNSCGRPDGVSATHQFDGTSPRHPDFIDPGTNPGCEAFHDRDDVSVVDFGALPPNKIGFTCTFFARDTGVNTALESDMRLNKREATWTVDPAGSGCTSQYSVRAVTAHERGHTFGLRHVTPEEEHGNLTMSPDANGPCEIMSPTTRLV